MARGHHAAILAFYGPQHGNRIARKHLGWMISRLAERGLISQASDRAWRLRLLQTPDNEAVRDGLAALYAEACAEQEARVA